MPLSVQLDKLKKRYVSPDGVEVPVIDIEELGIDDGEQIALIGSSGSGKTTLLHLIAGILTPDSGRILFGEGKPTLAPHADPPHDGEHELDYANGPHAEWVDITRLSEARRDVFRGRHIGYIFQTHHLLPGFTALENVLLGMTFTGKAHDPAWAKHLLQEVGLSDRLNYRPAKLSVGQQQRVAVARALANRPRLVLADEPTGALDTVNAQQVLGLIRRLCTEVNAALILVTHDLAIAGQLPRTLKLTELNRAAVGAVSTP
jgi:putative ABC transport system ATP-binding protein